MRTLISRPMAAPQRRKAKALSRRKAQWMKNSEIMNMPRNGASFELTKEAAYRRGWTRNRIIASSATALLLNRR